MRGLIDNGMLSWGIVFGPLAGAIGPAMSIASVGFSALGSLEGGQGQAAGDKFQAEVLEREAEYGRLKAMQTNAEMTTNLTRVLGNVDAVRAASHDQPSPTGSALRGTIEQAGVERKGIHVENILAQSQLQEDEAAYMRQAASSALMSSEIGAGADILKGFGGAIASSGGFGKLFGGGGGGYGGS